MSTYINIIEIFVISILILTAVMLGYNIGKEQRSSTLPLLVEDVAVRTAVNNISCALGSEFDREFDVVVTALQNTGYLAVGKKERV